MDEVKLLPCEGYYYSIAQLAPMSFKLMGDGRVLLQINHDGTVEGLVEDAGEAAKVFVEALRRQLEPMFASRPTLVTDEVVERALAKAEAQIDENERAMIEERKGQYGSAFKAEQLAAIQGLHKQQRNGVKLARSAIAAMPAIPPQSLDASETQEQWLARISAEQNRLRLLWLANAVLACDYGDNDTGGQIGWGVRADVRSGAPLMFGPSINAAIDNAIATGMAETPTSSPAIDQDGGEG